MRAADTKSRTVESATPVALPDAAWKRAFRRRLWQWYGLNARDFPWRHTRDPYRVWVSEVMLQQTQAATVVPYYLRFIAAFGDVKALSAASEDKVLRLWEGLGYYRRARQLHAAAARIVREHGGRFPRDVQSALSLPGVGRYTAGAVLSIAYDAREPILEANTVRLLSRLLAYRGDPTGADGEQLLWAAAAALLPRTRVGRFNQALMELGSQVCLPRRPRCEDCPVAALCPTRAAGLQDVIPRAKAPPRVTAVREAAVVVRRRGKVLLLYGHGSGRWAGLWDFPRFQLDARRGSKLREELIAKVAELAGVVIAPGERLLRLKHSVTRYRITLDCYDAACVTYRGRVSRRQQWLKPSELNEYPLHATARKLGDFLNERPT